MTNFSVMSCKRKAIGGTYRKTYISDEKGEAVLTHHKASPLSTGAVLEREEKFGTEKMKVTC